MGVSQPACSGDGSYPPTVRQMSRNIAKVRSNTEKWKYGIPM
jgi:hypothetical protein